VIRDYLIDSGIDASRMEVKAWGGKRPLYNKNSVNAKRNVRVEVEILAD
jgi:outer membrane protein OmpA-like peptidoglycan-associated protein